MTLTKKSPGGLRRQDFAVAARLALPPLITALLMLACFRSCGIYPFGRRSAAWGDMSQQIVPLLVQFKEMLSGDSPPSVFYSLRAAGGMNMYGVFFYYLASPFTFLVCFVRPEDMACFAGILVMLKMSLSALTASVCFLYCRKKLGAAEAVLLSVMYPFCGFALLYYQILPWLDIMCLFPLLITALERLFSGRGWGMYTAVLSACMVTQFYLCAVTALFIMLYSGVYTVSEAKTEHWDRQRRQALFRASGELLAGSVTAALLTAFVWLPSFLQIRASAKTQTSLTKVIAESQLMPELPTMLPLLLCCVFAVTVLSADLLTKRRHCRKTRQMLALLVLTFVPFLLEPVNKLWSFGNYICFPGRFAFITCFLMLYCCSDALSDRPVYRPDSLRAAVWGAGILGAMLLFLKYSRDIRRDSLADISRYTVTLWGDQRSLTLILSVFILTVICFAALWAAYRRGVFPRTVFIVLAGSLFVTEAAGNVGIYMGAPAERNEKSTEGRSRIYSLAGKISDDEFYRVKSAGKLYDNNLIGAMGYNTVCHYTSLTDAGSAETLRMLGYSAVGMEIGSAGGTRLSDALLSVRYEINGREDGSETFYSDSEGYISRLPDYLPQGLLLEKGSLTGTEGFPAGTDRTAAQELVSQKIFDESVIIRCEPEEELARKGGKYVLPAGTVLHYTAEVPDGERTLYFDCFDGMSTRFSESFFGSTEISVNGAKLGIFPSAVNNGAVCLGDIDEDTEIELRLTKDISVGSFGVFMVDNDALTRLTGRAESAGLTEGGKGILSGICTTDEPRTCLVTLPWSEGFTVRVNGRKVPYSRALYGFVGFDLEAGSSEIVIEFTPPGFAAGMLLTAAGVLLTAFRLIIVKKRGGELVCGKLPLMLMTAGSAAVFTAVYIVPPAVSILF